MLSRGLLSRGQLSPAALLPPRSCCGLGARCCRGAGAGSGGGSPDVGMSLSRAWRAATRAHGHSSHSSGGCPGRLRGASWQPTSRGPTAQHQNSHWGRAVPTARGGRIRHPSAPGRFLREAFSQRLGIPDGSTGHDAQHRARGPRAGCGLGVLRGLAGDGGAAGHLGTACSVLPGGWAGSPGAAPVLPGVQARNPGSLLELEFTLSAVSRTEGLAPPGSCPGFPGEFLLLPWAPALGQAGGCRAGGWPFPVAPGLVARDGASVPYHGTNTLTLLNLFSPEPSSLVEAPPALGAVFSSPVPPGALLSELFALCSPQAGRVGSLQRTASQHTTGWMASCHGLPPCHQHLRARGEGPCPASQGTPSQSCPQPAPAPQRLAAPAQPAEPRLGSDIPERWSSAYAGRAVSHRGRNHPSAQRGSRKPALTWCKHNPGIAARAAAGRDVRHAAGPGWPWGAQGRKQTRFGGFIKK